MISITVLTLQSQCSEEVEIVKEVEYVTALQCQEELQNKCHTSYVTRSAQV